MTYNMTMLQNSTTISKLFMTANSYTGNTLIGMFMVVFFFILLAILKSFDTKDAFIAASFISFVVSGLLSYGGFLNFIFPILFLTLTATSVLVKHFSS